MYFLYSNTLDYLTLMHTGPATIPLPAKPLNVLCIKGFPHLFHHFVTFKATEGGRTRGIGPLAASGRDVCVSPAHDGSVRAGDTEQD